MLSFKLKDDVLLIGYKYKALDHSENNSGGIVITEISNEKPFNLKKGTLISFATYKMDDGNFKTGFVTGGYFFPFSEIKDIADSLNYKDEDSEIKAPTNIQRITISGKGNNKQSESNTQSGSDVSPESNHLIDTMFSKRNVAIGSFVAIFNIIAFAIFKNNK